MLFHAQSLVTEIAEFIPSKHLLAVSEAIEFKMSRNPDTAMAEVLDNHNMAVAELPQDVASG